MEFEELAIPGVWKAFSGKLDDQRGSFSEWYRSEEISLATGLDFNVRQGNVSFSKRGVVRGIHYSLASLGQAKWVTCLLGSVVDFIVDIRINSPTFGKWIALELNGNNGLAVLIPSGLGHAFVSLEDDSCFAYLLTSSYSPSYEYAINPLDSTLKIDWGIGTNELHFSQKDREAPSLNDQMHANLLPIFQNPLNINL